MHNKIDSKTVKKKQDESAFADTPKPNLGRRNVVGVEYAARASRPVQLVAVVTPPLGGTVAVGRGAAIVSTTHGATLGAGGLAHLYGLRVDDEAVLAAIDPFDYALAYLFAQARRLFAAVVVLPPGDEVRQLFLTYGELVEQVVLAVYPQCLCGQAQGDDFKVGKARDDPYSGDIPQRVDQILGVTLADIKNLSELCAKVVHGAFL